MLTVFIKYKSHQNYQKCLVLVYKNRLGNRIANLNVSIRLLKAALNKMIVLISVIICFTVKNKYYKTINIFIKNTNKLVNTF